VYRWARNDELFLFGDRKFLGVGGGGEFALRIGEDFLKGQCGICKTFNNELLSDREFTIRKLEVWGTS